MNPLYAAAFVFAGIAIAFAIVGVYMRWRIRSNARKAERARATEPLDLTVDEARVVDPTDPPRAMIYRPRGDAPQRLCTCHQKPLRVGSPVTLWPIPNHPDGAMDIFCEDTMKAADL